MMYHLRLDYGIIWAFEASVTAAPWLENFATSMGLSEGESTPDRKILFDELPVKPCEPSGPLPDPAGQRFRALPAGWWQTRDFIDMAFYRHPALMDIICKLHRRTDWRGQVEQMRRSVLPLLSDALLAGGLPVHGALCEIDGSGVILAGRSGAGKSTSCRRLPPPWRVLADDLCLVVCCRPGIYRAHPLPTWSAITPDGTQGRSRTGDSVPLRAIFFLGQSRVDECRGLKESTAAVSLISSAQQVVRTLHHDFRYEGYPVNRALYSNAASIALAVPSHHLSVSLTGRFWEMIEDALEIGGVRIDDRTMGEWAREGTG